MRHVERIDSAVFLKFVFVSVSSFSSFSLVKRRQLPLVKLVSIIWNFKSAFGGSFRSNVEAYDYYFLMREMQRTDYTIMENSIYNFFINYSGTNLNGYLHRVHTEVSAIINLDSVS